MAGQRAARLNDPIAHTNAHARFWVKAAAGLVGGLVVGALAAAAMVAVVGTGGAALALLPALAVAGAEFVGGFVGAAAGEAIADWAMPETFEVTGKITLASPNVFINDKSRGAVRATPAAPLDPATCSKDNPPIRLTAEGSDSVFINAASASRKGDHITCGAVISDGSENVLIGGNQIRLREVADEVPLISRILKTIIDIAMIANALRCLPKLLQQGKAALPCLLSNLAGAGVGIYGLVGHPVHVASGTKVLNGEHDTDFTLPGPITLAWRRIYNSDDVRADGLLGQGWGLPLSVQLDMGLNAAGETELAYTDEQGRTMHFPAPEPGHSHYLVAEGTWLYCTEGGHYVVQPLGGLYYAFAEPIAGLPAQTLPLVRIEDNNANFIALRHDDAGRLTSLTDSTGRLLKFDHDGDSRRIAAVHLTQGAPGEQTETLARYRYDTNGQLTEVVNRMGQANRSFCYQNRLMIRHTLPTGLECHYAWKGEGKAAHVIRHWTSDGEAYDFQYERAEDNDGNPIGRTTVIDQLQRRQVWHWNADFQIIAYTNAHGHTWHLEWNDQRQLLKETTPDGHATTYSYDDYGNRTGETDALGNSRSTTWISHLGAPLIATEPDGRRWQFAYDDRANLIQRIDPLGQITAYTWSKRGMPLTITDANGGTVKLAWSERAQLIGYTDCSCKSTRYEYDGRGYLAAKINALGQETSYTRDALGRLTSITASDGTNRKFTYGAGGQLASATDPLNRVAGYQYNVRGQIIGRRDKDGKRIESTYDKAHRLSMHVNENCQAYRFRYDELDRLVEEIRVDGSRQSFEYNASNQVVAIIDHPGDGDVIEGHPATQSIRIELKRDEVGRLMERRTPDALYRYRYDQIGRLLEAHKTTLEGQALHTNRFGYSKLGDLVFEEAVDAVAGTTSVLRHDYDPLGNRTSTTLPDGRTLNHLYYGSGHLHQINLDGEIIADFERDDLHREISRSQSGLTSRYALDAQGRRTAVWTQLSILRAGAWDPDGTEWEKRLSAPGGGDVLLKKYQYDPVGELRHAHHSRNGEVDYRYDQTGHIESTRSSIQGLSEFFYFDPAGNRITAQEKHEGWGQIKNNRVKVMEDKRFDYDGFGRLIRKRIGPHTVQHFKYDSQHRMVTAAVIRRNPKDPDKPLHQLFHYRYDALGRRIAKQDIFGETHFEWDGMRLLQERRGGKQSTYVYEQVGSYRPLARIDGSGKIDSHQSPKFTVDPEAKAKSIPRININEGWDDAFNPVGGWDAKARVAANQELVRAVPDVTVGNTSEPEDTAKIYYFHTQANGLPEELSDSKGNLVWRAVYKAWGNTVGESWYEVDPNADSETQLRIVREPEQQQNLRMQGQYLDRETGLHYNTFRCYDPDMGCFTTPDPIGLYGGINLHQYAPNPIRWVDPWGWYNGEGERTLGEYPVLFEHNLPSSDYTKSDDFHFSSGNEGLYEAMKNDPALRAQIEAKYPGTWEHVQPGAKGAFSTEPPPGTTWHHADKPGSLELVDRADHRKFHKIYHPDGTGGRNKWGGGTGCR